MAEEEQVDKGYIVEPEPEGQAALARRSILDEPSDRRTSGKFRR